MGANLLSLGLGQVAPRHWLSFRERGSWRRFYLQVIGFEMTSREILAELLTTLAQKFSHDAEAFSQVAVVLTELTEVVHRVGD